VLRAETLRFAYPGGATAYSFSLEAKPGEVTAINGPSGSGKSTLLDLLAGFLRPQSGTLTLDGRSLLPLPPEDRPLSLQLQSESLFDHLSAGANVALGLPRGRRDPQAITDALLQVGFSIDIAGQRASTLSGGQKQRVALARTLLRARPILLLDEPFSALDDEARRSTRELVGMLTSREGWHTLLVSHNSDDVAALASRHYRIEGGQLRLV
jgi:thiamine transport system ATP-binding protein